MESKSAMRLTTSKIDADKPQPSTPKSGVKPNASYNQGAFNNIFGASRREEDKKKEELIKNVLNPQKKEEVKFNNIFKSPSKEEPKKMSFFSSPQNKPQDNQPPWTKQQTMGSFKDQTKPSKNSGAINFFFNNQKKMQETAASSKPLFETKKEEPPKPVEGPASTLFGGVMADYLSKKRYF